MPIGPYKLSVIIIINYYFSVYDVSGAGSDRNSVVLNDIHIDIMDYIVPASCTDTEFRQMWAEFEWENKVGNILMTISCFFQGNNYIFKVLIATVNGLF